MRRRHRIVFWDETDANDRTVLLDARPAAGRQTEAQPRIRYQKGADDTVEYAGLRPRADSATADFKKKVLARVVGK